ncbi:MAG TPA: hypothetical protein VLJ17_24740 [Xanthobacteraceae bacterium]|nr:hypothetical protein [Xanthobacteraceae bacterium]
MTPISPKTHQSAVQKTVIMVDAVTLLTSIQHLDQEATSVFMSALGAFQALKPVQRTQIAYALHQLFP